MRRIPCAAAILDPDDVGALLGCVALDQRRARAEFFEVLPHVPGILAVRALSSSNISRHSITSPPRSPASARAPPDAAMPSVSGSTAGRRARRASLAGRRRPQAADHVAQYMLGRSSAPSSQNQERPSRLARSSPLVRQRIAAITCSRAHAAGRWSGQTRHSSPHSSAYTRRRPARANRFKMGICASQEGKADDDIYYQWMVGPRGLHIQPV